MDFSFVMEGAKMTGNISPEAIDSIIKMLRIALGGITLAALFLSIIVGILMIIASWKVFEKAKLPGRGIFIPIYNIVLFFKL